MSKNMSLVLTCIDAEECLVAFEPEGATHVLRRGDRFNVTISGPGTGEIEVSYIPRGLIVGAWSGSTTKVWNREGKQLPT